MQHRLPPPGCQPNAERVKAQVRTFLKSWRTANVRILRPGEPASPNMTAAEEWLKLYTIEQRCSLARKQSQLCSSTDNLAAERLPALQVLQC